MKALKKLKSIIFQPKRIDIGAKELETINASETDSIQASHEVIRVYREGHEYYFRRLDDLRAIQASFATYKLADLLELSNMIPPTRVVKLKTIKDDIIGTLQNGADGVCIIGIGHSERRDMITPAFQHALMNLNVLDVLTHDADHSPNNYNVVLDSNEMAIGVSCFDNNGVGTFSCSGSISFETFKKCSPFVDSVGMINRPYLDKNLIRRIQEVRFIELFKRLRTNLRFYQIFAVWIRMKKVIHAVSRISSDRLLDDSAWGEDTIQEELSGRYGKTYLVGYIEDCCVSPSES